MIELLIYFGAAALLLGGPLVLVLWDVLVTEPRQRRRQRAGEESTVEIRR